MQMQVTLSTGNEDLVISVPVQMKRKSGRKHIILPDGEAQPHMECEPDDYLVKALLRAYRWNKMLAAEKAGSITELARMEGVAESYLARVLRLSLLAPDIKQAILNGQHPRGFRLNDMFKTFPLLWDEQRKWFGFSSG